MRQIAAAAVFIILTLSPALAGSLCDQIEQDGRDTLASACRQDEFERDQALQRQRDAADRQHWIDEQSREADETMRQYLSSGRR